MSVPVDRDQALLAAIQQTLPEGETVEKKEVEKHVVDFLEACQQGRLKTVKSLVEKHPDIVAEYDGASRTGLHFAANGASEEIAFDVAAYLLRRAESSRVPRAEVSHADTDGITPLHLSCKRGWSKLTELLCEAGADVNAKTKRGASPLYEACSAGSLSIVQSLLKRGAALDPKDAPECGTPLHAIAGCDSADRSSVMAIARLMYEDLHCSVDATDSLGATPLIYAAGHGRRDLVEFLLQRRADPNKRMQGSGISPLHMATELGAVEIVQHLLSKGALQWKDDGNHTPFDLAIRNRAVELARLLKDVPVGSESPEETRNRVGPLLDRYRAAGNQAFQMRQFDDAARLYSKALDLDNRNHILLSNRSACYFNMGLFQQALEDAQAALKAEPNFIRAYFRAAAALNRLGRRKEAADVAEAGLLLEPKNEELQRELDLAREDAAAVPA